MAVGHLSGVRGEALPRRACNVHRWQTVQARLDVREGGTGRPFSHALGAVGAARAPTIPVADRRHQRRPAEAFPVPARGPGAA